MHYRHNKFQNFLQNLALDAHDALHRKSTLAFIRHCSRVGGGDDTLAIDKGGNLPEKVENHWLSISSIILPQTYKDKILFANLFFQSVHTLIGWNPCLWRHLWLATDTKPKRPAVAASLV